MSSLQYVAKITRPKLIVLASASTWVIAMLSNGPDMLTVHKMAATVVIALSVLGASLYHFGAANPMYTRKNEALNVGPLFKNCLIVAGVLSMFSAVHITAKYLGTFCQIIVFVDAIIILAYAGILSRHWLTKNLLMAFVCVSPVLLGWFAGERLHPHVPYGIAITFFAYLAREITKDIQDIIANHGYRHTLPLWLGVIPARRITAVIMTLALISLAVFSLRILNEQWYVLIPCIFVWYYWLKATHAMATKLGGTEAAESKQILLGSVWLMLSFLALIF